MPHLIDLFIYRGIFLYIGISLGNICLRLIIIIVTYEVLNCVVGKKVFEFPIKLGGQGLIGGNNKGGPLGSCHDMGYGKCLPRAGHSKQYLMPASFFYLFVKGINRMSLIAFGFKW